MDSWKLACACKLCHTHTHTHTHTLVYVTDISDWFSHFQSVQAVFCGGWERVGLILQISVNVFVCVCVCV